MSLGKFLNMYQKLLNRRPFLMQAVQTGVLMYTGDAVAQLVIEKQPKQDLIRSLKFASIGFFYVGPGLRIWYGVLNKYIGSGGAKVGVQKVFCDQVLFAPFFLCSLLTLVPALQGKSWEEIKKDLEANYVDVLTTNYCIWPWVQLVNFSFVPLQYQVLLAQTVALFWNIYLAWKTNTKRSDDSLKKEPTKKVIDAGDHKND